MSINSDEIRQYFLQNGKEEFVIYPREAEYYVIGSSHKSPQVLYSTKMHSLLRCLSHTPHSIPDHIQLIGRYGLPNSCDVGWIAQFLENKEVYFLGDLDAVDLLVYAWLRQWVCSTIAFLGINDDLLRRLGVHSIERTCIMPCSSEEADALRFLRDSLPNLPTIVGPNCMQLLESGEKFELQALLRLAQLHRPELLSNLLLPQDYL